MNTRPSLFALPLAGLIVLAALLAGCGAPQPRSDAPAAAGSEAPALFDNDSLDPSDVRRRSKLKGCDLIPYDALRTVCVDQNDGLHGADACGAQACQRQAGHAANEQRLRAWSSCYVRRVAIYDAFQSTLDRIAAFKSKNPQYKGWDKPAKDALTVLVDKIKAGQPGHKKAQKNAKKALDDCQKIVQNSDLKQ